MKYLNRDLPNCGLNIILRKFYKQKQKVNNSNKYINEEKEMIMKGIEMCINLTWNIAFDRNNEFRDALFDEYNKFEDVKIFNV